MNAIMTYDAVIDDKITNRKEAMLVLEIAKGQMSQITSDDLKSFQDLEYIIRFSFPNERERSRDALKKWGDKSVFISLNISNSRTAGPLFRAIEKACALHRQYIELKKQFSQ